MKSGLIAGLTLLLASCSAPQPKPLIPKPETAYRHQLMHEAVYKLPRETRKHISDTYLAIAPRLPDVQSRQESCNLKVHWQELFPYCFDGTLDARIIDEIQMEDADVYGVLLEVSAEVDRTRGKHLYSP